MRREFDVHMSENQPSATEHDNRELGESKITQKRGSTHCSRGLTTGQNISLERHLRSQCFSRLPPHWELRVYYSTMEGNRYTHQRRQVH